jgi:hypothetical protein
MSLEDEVREAFRKHGDDAQPDMRSWNAVEKKVRRAHHQRVAFVSTLTVAAIAVVAVLVPRLGANKTTKGTFLGQTPSASSKPSSHPTSRPSATSQPLPQGFGEYRDDGEGWQLAYPTTWKTSRFEGTTEYFPPGAPSPEQGGPSFWVSVSIRDGAPSAQKGGPVTASTDLDHRTAGVTITGPPGGGETRLYEYNWTGLCVSRDSCPAGAATLQLIVQGTDATWWDRYHTTGESIVQTLEIAKTATTKGDVQTRHGIVSASAAQHYDIFTSTLVQFLNARVEGGNAESFMSPQATRQFADPSNCLELYETRATHKQWTNYEVIGRFNATAKATFTLRMLTDPNNGGFVESLVVGRSGSSADVQILAGNPSCSGT